MIAIQTNNLAITDTLQVLRVVNRETVVDDAHNRQLVIDALAHSEIFHKIRGNPAKAQEYGDLRKQIERDFKIAHRLLNKEP